MTLLRGVVASVLLCLSFTSVEGKHQLVVSYDPEFESISIRLSEFDLKTSEAANALGGGGSGAGIWKVNDVMEEASLLGPGIKRVPSASMLKRVPSGSLDIIRLSGIRTGKLAKFVRKGQTSQKVTKREYGFAVGSSVRKTMSVLDPKDVNEIKSYLLPMAIRCPALMSKTFQFPCNASDCEQRKVSFAKSKSDYALGLKRLVVQFNDLKTEDEVSKLITKVVDLIFQATVEINEDIDNMLRLTSGSTQVSLIENIMTQLDAGKVLDANDDTTSTELVLHPFTDQIKGTKVFGTPKARGVGCASASCDARSPLVTTTDVPMFELLWPQVATIKKILTNSSKVIDCSAGEVDARMRFGLSVRNALVEKSISLTTELGTDKVDVFAQVPYATGGTIGAKLVDLVTNKKLVEWDKEREISSIVTKLAVTMKDLVEKRYTVASPIGSEDKRKKIFNNTLGKKFQHRFSAGFQNDMEEAKQLFIELEEFEYADAIEKMIPAYMEGAKRVMRILNHVKMSQHLLPKFSAPGLHSDANLGNMLLVPVTTFNELGEPVQVDNEVKFNDNGSDENKSEALSFEVFKSYFGIVHQGILSKKYHVEKVESEIQGKLKLTMWKSSVWMKNEMESIAKRFSSELNTLLEQYNKSQKSWGSRIWPYFFKSEDVIDVTAFSQRYQLYALIQRLSDSGYVIVNENDDKWSDFNTNVRALKGVTKKKSDLSEEFIVNAIEAIKKTVERLVVNLEIFQDETNESFLKSLEEQMLR